MPVYQRQHAFQDGVPANGGHVRAELDLVEQASNLLGYTQITGNLTTASAGTQVQATGLTVTVTIPSATRRVKITAWAESIVCQGASYMQFAIWDGTVGSGTQLALSQPYISGTGQNFSAICIAVVTPTTGSKTYNVGWCGNSGTATLTASSTSPAFIMAEVI